MKVNGIIVSNKNINPIGLIKFEKDFSEASKLETIMSKVDNKE